VWSHVSFFRFVLFADAKCREQVEEKEEEKRAKGGGQARGGGRGGVRGEGARRATGGGRQGGALNADIVRHSVVFLVLWW